MKVLVVLAIKAFFFAVMISSFLIASADQDQTTITANSLSEPSQKCFWCIECIGCTGLSSL